MVEQVDDLDLKGVCYFIIVFRIQAVVREVGKRLRTGLLLNEVGGLDIVVRRKLAGAL